jgi:hypothetical protein
LKFIGNDPAEHQQDHQLRDGGRFGEDLKKYNHSILGDTQCRIVFKDNLL